MNKEQTLQALDAKFQPVLQKKTMAKIAAEDELRDEENKYSIRREKIEEYFKALEEKARIDLIINNPPTI